MASKTGPTTTPKTGTGGNKTPKSTASDLPNLAFDTATQNFLNASYGTEASWYNDPQIGPVLKAALVAGKDSKGNPVALQGQQYQDFIRTHAVDPNNPGKVIKVAPDQSWYGTHGANVRLAFGQKLSDPATYNENVTQTILPEVQARDRALGTNLDPATLLQVAQTAYENGWSGSSDLLDTALLAQHDKNTGPNAGTPNIPTLDPATGNPVIPGATPAPASGAIAKAQSDFASIAADYAIPLPNDPTQMQNFIKGAVGPGGTEDAFTQYAKQQAMLQFPWMTQALENGATVKGYLQPYTTQIANTLGISEDSINWTDPKWQSVVAKKAPDGSTIPQTADQALQTIKTDPRFGYNQTAQAKNDAYNAVQSIGQMFGFTV